MVAMLIMAGSGIGLYIAFFNSNNIGISIPFISKNDNNEIVDSGLLIVNHTHSHLEDFVVIPLEWINKSKEDLHIVYWHTSHGSQLTDGMDPLDEFMGNNDTYEYNSAGSGGALHLNEPASDDLTGNTNGFDDTTRTFLNANPIYNVIIWSWCGLDTNNASINAYLNNMNQLESEYPNKTFVYMTGHLDGSGEEGDVHYYNERIRSYCFTNNKTLYDFADIESYNPDDENYLVQYANDECYYDGDGDGVLEQGGDDASYNWAQYWQINHNGVDTYYNGGEWYSCSCAHSEPVNGNMKAYGAWYLFARIAGWNGTLL
ncbi:MAG: Exoglucanase B [Promethearchaeota archaeon]|nr:MAG: Exoglucanase B [Candidatus Lokiarchaeota archaeon]